MTLQKKLFSPIFLFSFSVGVGPGIGYLWIKAHQLKWSYSKQDCKNSWGFTPGKALKAVGLYQNLGSLKQALIMIKLKPHPRAFTVHFVMQYITKWL